VPRIIAATAARVKKSAKATEAANRHPCLDSRRHQQRKRGAEEMRKSFGAKKNRLEIIISKAKHYEAEEKTDRKTVRRAKKKSRASRKSRGRANI